MRIRPSNCAIFSHPDCARHDPGPDHPDRPERIETVISSLRAADFSNVEWRVGRSITAAELEMVHDPEYLRKLEATTALSGLWNLDRDTIVCADSLTAAQAAAGTVCSAVDAVCEDQNNSAFCVVRPPGHHAEQRNALGFCILNNLAIGANHARAKYNIRRIAIIDIDAHHGNGAQNIFWNDAEMLVVSIHQRRLSFLTGDADECGAHNNVLNCPLEAGADGSALRAGLLGSVLPRMKTFRPELVLIAAGFDAHADDTLSQLQYSCGDFAWAGAQIAEAAGHLCDRRIVASLEGGYNLNATAACAAAFVKGLIGQHDS